MLVGGCGHHHGISMETMSTHTHYMCACDVVVIVIVNVYKHWPQINTSLALMPGPQTSPKVPCHVIKEYGVN